MDTDNTKGSREVKKNEQYFAAMINDISWKSLKSILLYRKKYSDLFKQGGFQFKQKNTSRAQNIIINNSDREDYQILFYYWSSEKKKYMELLEPVFEKNALNEEEQENNKRELYDIDQTIFSNLINSLSREHAMFFLHFSPFKLTKEQKKILSEHEDPNEIKKPTIKVEKKKDGDDDKIKILRQELNKHKKTIGENKKEIKRLQNTIASLKMNIEHSSDELNQLQDIQIKYEEKIVQIENLAKKKNNTLIEKLIGKGNKLSESLQKNKDILVELEKRNKKIAMLELQLKKSDNSLRENVTAIFNRININKLTGSLNEPDEVKELMLSVIQVPNQDGSDLNNFDDKQFKKSWFSLSKDELKTIKQILKLDIKYLSENEFSKKWPDYSDLLIDLKYSLKARAALIDVIYEIMKEFFDAEKYKKTVIKKPKKKSIFQNELNRLTIPATTISKLEKAKIYNIGQLVYKQERELLRLRIGRNELKRLKSALSELNLKLGMKRYK
jgi:dihydroneopterin aldolase